MLLFLIIAPYIYISNKTTITMKFASDLFLHPAIFLMLFFTLSTLGLKVYLLTKRVGKAKSLPYFQKLAKLTLLGNKNKAFSFR